MADKENAAPAAGPRLTRAAAKRAAAAAASGAAKRRRVALGDLPTLSNAVVLRPSSHPIKPSKPAKPAAGEEAHKPVDSSSSASASPPAAGEPCGDPQPCGAYASDIYGHAMELLPAELAMELPSAKLAKEPPPDELAMEPPLAAQISSFHHSCCASLLQVAEVGREREKDRGERMK